MAIRQARKLFVEFNPVAVDNLGNNDKGVALDLPGLGEIIAPNFVNLPIKSLIAESDQPANINWLSHRYATYYILSSLARRNRRWRLRQMAQKLYVLSNLHNVLNLSALFTSVSQTKRKELAILLDKAVASEITSREIIQDRLAQLCEVAGFSNLVSDFSDYTFEQVGVKARRNTKWSGGGNRNEIVDELRWHRRLWFAHSELADVIKQKKLVRGEYPVQIRNGLDDFPEPIYGIATVNREDLAKRLPKIGRLTASQVGYSNWSKIIPVLLSKEFGLMEGKGVNEMSDELKPLARRRVAKSTKLTNRRGKLNSLALTSFTSALQGSLDFYFQNFEIAGYKGRDAVVFIASVGAAKDEILARFSAEYNNMLLDSLGDKGLIQYDPRVMEAFKLEMALRVERLQTPTEVSEENEENEESEESLNRLTDETTQTQTQIQTQINPDLSNLFSSSASAEDWPSALEKIQTQFDPLIVDPDDDLLIDTDPVTEQAVKQMLVSLAAWHPPAIETVCQRAKIGAREFIGAIMTAPLEMQKERLAAQLAFSASDLLNVAIENAKLPENTKERQFLLESAGVGPANPAVVINNNNNLTSNHTHNTAVINVQNELPDWNAPIVREPEKIITTKARQIAAPIIVPDAIIEPNASEDDLQLVKIKPKKIKSIFDFGSDGSLT